MPLCDSPDGGGATCFVVLDLEDQSFQLSSLGHEFFLEWRAVRLQSRGSELIDSPESGVFFRNSHAEQFVG
jgi:hypothetical protein